MKKTVSLTALGALLVAALTVSMIAGQTPARGGAATGPCDRACLEGFIDRYLDAMAARDPKQLPLAANVKYTENGQRLNLGDGTWNTATAKGVYKLFVTDTTAGQVAFIGTMKEEAGSIMMALRLKVVNRQITEAEAIVVRPAAAGGAGGRGAAPAGGRCGPRRCTRPGRPAVDGCGIVGLDGKTPRALSHGSAARGTDVARRPHQGSEHVFFRNAAKRRQRRVSIRRRLRPFENASKTTNNGQPRPDPKTATTYSAAWSCKEQFESGLIHFVSRIRDRRYVAVDQERGLVYSFAFFDHMAGKTRTYQVPDGRTVTGGPNRPWTWEIAEMFKIEKGKIRRIEAILTEVPYGMPSGWSSWEDGMSDRARDVTK
jgi:hypothetical protein